MGRILHPLFALLASVTRQDLARQDAYLKAENQILRARLPKHIVTTEKERNRLVKAGRKLGIQLKPLISIVTYQSFLRWVREIEARPRDSVDCTRIRRKPGRPRTPEEIRDVILRIRKESGFGYTRILGELRKMGIWLSRQTVKNILKEAGLWPNPEDCGDSWDSFLKRHAETLWQCDFAPCKGGSFLRVRAPPGNWCFQPEAIGAAVEVTKPLKPSMERVAFSLPHEI